MGTLPLDCFEKMLVTRPVLLLSARQGRYNTLSPLIWYTPVSIDPPMLGISLKPSSASYHYIRESGDFIAGVPGASMLKALHFCGVHSGRDLDKPRHLDLGTTRGVAASPLLISNCMANIECRVRQVIQTGNRPFLTGEILSVTAEHHYFDEERGWKEEACLIHYLGGNRYRVEHEIIDMSATRPGYVPPDSVG